MVIKNNLTATIVATSISIGVFAALCIGAIVITQQLTKADIAQQRYQAKIALLQELLADTRYNNNLLASASALPNSTSLGIIDSTRGYKASLDQQTVAIILPITSNDGYSGKIELLVAVGAQHKVIGVRALVHQETPGLGDKIEIKKSDWINSFIGKSLDNTPSNAWGVKKHQGDFDQLTGATITSRAVINAVHETLVYIQKNPQLLDERTIKNPVYN
jgi:Na+-translocating ferredoxin:NAD+ oxidoreductase subunit G